MRFHQEGIDTSLGSYMMSDTKNGNINPLLVVANPSVRAANSAGLLANDRAKSSNAFWSMCLMSLWVMRRHITRSSGDVRRYLTSGVMPSIGHNEIIRRPLLSIKRAFSSLKISMVHSSSIHTKSPCHPASAWRSILWDLKVIVLTVSLGTCFTRTMSNMPGG